MSKILEKNSVGKALRGYWRLFAGWVIGLKNKWQDPLIKSELNVIFLQIIFAATVLILSYEFFYHLYKEILDVTLAGIIENIASGDLDISNGGEKIIASLDLVRSKNFGYFTAILIVLTIVFVVLVTKVTLKPARNALESQKRFISDIAHELRTPLAIIKTNNEVALMEDNVSKEIEDMIKSNIEELDRMSDIINNILSFNNLIRPNRIIFTNIDMGPVIDSAVRKLQDLSEKKNLEIVVKKVAPITVWGNSVALEQIVSNLLKNAINYTPKDGRITIRIGPDYYGNILLHIEDTGIGITKEDLMHIFQPFYRAEKSRNRGKGSSGLGLAIVSELVKIHSGRITIKSAENKGTVAIVTLPYGKDNDMEENVDLSKLNEVSINYLREEG